MEEEEEEEEEGEGEVGGKDGKNLDTHNTDKECQAVGSSCVTVADKQCSDSWSHLCSCLEAVIVRQSHY